MQGVCAVLLEAVEMLEEARRRQRAGESNRAVERRHRVADVFTRQRADRLDRQVAPDATRQEAVRAIFGPFHGAEKAQQLPRRVAGHGVVGQADGRGRQRLRETREGPPQRRRRRNFPRVFSVWGPLRIRQRIVLLGSRTGLRQRAQRPVNGLEPRAQRRHALLPKRRLHQAPLQSRAQHGARPFAKLVRFVDDEAGTRTRQRRCGQPLQAHHGIEDVVVVAHHHVRPRRRLQGELERTHREAPRHLLHVLAPAQATGQQFAARGRRSVEVAPGIAAQLRIARRAWVEADALLGRDRHAGQRPPLRAHPRQRLLRRLLPGAAGRQEHEPVENALAHRLQRRKHARHRLARTRRRLHQPVRAIAETAKDALGQLPLVRVEAGIRKAQPSQLRVALRQPRRHGIQPRDVEAASGLEERDQLGRLPALVEDARRRGVVGVQVDEPQPQFAGGFVAEHEHGRVEPQLRQMDGAGVPVQRGSVGAGGLHFLHQGGGRVPAVDSAGHLQCAEGDGHGMFAAVRLAPLLLPAALPGNALLGQRRGLERRMQVAAPVDELGQFLDARSQRRHHALRKRSTRTGRPRSRSAWIHSR